MSLRLSKISLLLCVALYSTLVAFNNVTDYSTNLQFVAHVLQMDTTFPDNSVMWRSIDSSSMQHFAYIGIIVVEWLIAVLSWIGVIQLWRARNDRAAFAQRKTIATAALTLGIVLWFGGFIAVGGEWFLMWQSQTWNGIQSAFRIATFLMLVLLFFYTDD